jgi:hypothetical protein
LCCVCGSPKGRREKKRMRCCVVVLSRVVWLTCKAWTIWFKFAEYNIACVVKTLFYTLSVVCNTSILCDFNGRIVTHVYTCVTIRVANFDFFFEAQGVASTGRDAVRRSDATTPMPGSVYQQQLT